MSMGAAGVEHVRPDWLDALPAQALIAAFDSAGQPLRFVGGCVRDTLLKRPVSDLDATTPATPDQVMACVEAHGLKAIPTGLDHGTVTVLCHGVPIEVTTLRRDVATDGRHASVAFTTDWAADACRRDFTINALYMDGAGVVHDPLGTGVQDITTLTVRFIHDAHQRIQEDYLRILRFFRFTARFNSTVLDGSALAACAAHVQGLTTLSAERVTAELLRILDAEEPQTTLHAMSECGVFTPLFPAGVALTDLQRLLVVERSLAVETSALLRLACLLTPSQAALERNFQGLRLSKADRARVLCTAQDRPEMVAVATDMDVRRVLYLMGKVRVQDGLLLTAEAHGLDRVRHWLEMAATWPVPAFPIAGQDLVQAGLPPGPQVGACLKALEHSWIDSDFTLSRADLLAQL